MWLNLSIMNDPVYFSTDAVASVIIINKCDISTWTEAHFCLIVSFIVTLLHKVVFLVYQL